MCLKKINFVVGALKKCLNLLHCILCKYSLKLFCFVGCLQILMAVCRGFILVLKFVLLLLLLLLLSILPKHFLHVSVIFLAPTTSVCRGCNGFTRKPSKPAQWRFGDLGGQPLKVTFQGVKYTFLHARGPMEKFAFQGLNITLLGSLQPRDMKTTRSNSVKLA